jgi:toxin FitB
MMQLVDTNVLSELARPQPDAGVLKWLKAYQQHSNCFMISAVTIDELAFGVARRPSAALQAWLDGFMGLHDVVAITGEIARQAGELRARLAAQGHTRTQADMLIAATAQRHGLTLVTRNVRDFDQCGIAVLDPFES